MDKKEREQILATVMQQINALHFLRPSVDPLHEIRHSFYAVIAHRAGIKLKGKKIKWGQLTKNQLRDVYCLVRYRMTHSELLEYDRMKKNQNQVQ